MDLARPYHHENLSDELLTAALEELRDRGLRDFSLRRVAARAGVSRGAPYRHFSGKDDLLAALTAEGFRRLTAALEAADKDCSGSAFDKLLAQGGAYLRFGAEQPELLELVFSGAGLGALHRAKGNVDPAELARYNAFGVLEGRVAACQTEGALPEDVPPELLATVIWSSVHGIAVLKREGVFATMAEERGHSPEEAQREVLGAFAKVFFRTRSATATPAAPGRREAGGTAGA